MESAISMDEEPVFQKTFEDANDTSDDSSRADAENQGIARRENKAVVRSKILVYIVIGMCAVTFGTVTYFITKNDEDEDFRTSFRHYSQDIVDLARLETDSMLGSIQSLVHTWTSYTLDSQATWPRFTMPHFEPRGLKSNELSLALQVTMVPLVHEEERAIWEEYSVANQQWVQDGVDFSSERHSTFFESGESIQSIPTTIRRFDDSGAFMTQTDQGVDFGSGFHFGPVWQQVPAPHDTGIINYDVLSNADIATTFRGMYELESAVISKVTDLNFLFSGALEQQDSESPHSFMLHPVYSSFDHSEGLVGFALSVIEWSVFFEIFSLNGIKGIFGVLHNTCGQDYTFFLDENKVEFLGEGDLHDTSYDSLGVREPFTPTHQLSEEQKFCDYEIHLYPSSTMEKSYSSARPAVYATLVFCVFVFTAFVFTAYDWLLQRRKNHLEEKAKQANAVVTSLFPSNVRDRILKDVNEQVEKDFKDKKGKKFFRHAKTELKTFLDDEEKGEGDAFDTKPIADLFPQATVMFADIVGFTAWSSVREPSQVFTLLETVYHAFDEIARRRRVFKVETVGDCYVAVVGLPDPRGDHAIVMARFAKDCLYKMNYLTKQLEVALGPDTGDLSMRIGLHSGPVTAGVLRGDKSRFQLFGDTVNTAAKIEGSGERNRIHISSETADLLTSAGKGHWLTKRQDKVQTKGKGTIQTFWLKTSVKREADDDDSVTAIDAAEQEAAVIVEVKTMEVVDEKAENPTVSTAVQNTPKPTVAFEDAKLQRLVNWNVDVLGRLMKQIIARRQAKKEIQSDDQSILSPGESSSSIPTSRQVIEEVQEIISLPEFDAEAAKLQMETEAVALDEEVLSQLKDYVQTLALMYRENPFHNFEHASHVTMSVVKLLSRIVSPETIMKSVSTDNSGQDVASSLHEHTYGITSDPLTQFACVFAALIHDTDHSGVPNAQLVKESDPLAKIYHEKSVAEQHSVNLAWDLLMQDRFGGICKALCATDEEMRRFRQLVVNSVMATDIVDKELKALRNARWENAFAEVDGSTTESKTDQVNRKATIVIEHLIQASDVAHTMQHWHIYRKWNERFFHEMYNAYRNGRAAKDPVEFWYKGELGFFDFYIIPLAKKLKDCGVFGVSSDEYLNYAEKNRREWEAKGQEVLEGMAEKYRKMYSVEEEVKLDEVQDSDKPTALRSQLVSSETDAKV